MKSVSFASDETYSVDVDRSADLDPLLQRLRRVDQNVLARFHLPLIERAAVTALPVQQTLPPYDGTGFIGS